MYIGRKKVSNNDLNFLQIYKQSKSRATFINIFPNESFYIK